MALLWLITKIIIIDVSGTVWHLSIMNWQLITTDLIKVKHDKSFCLAQPVEQGINTAGVRGSIPTRGDPHALMGLSEALDKSL